MQLTVGTNPVSLDPTQSEDSRESGLILILQNNGPSDIYFDFEQGLSASTGVRVASGGAYEFPRASARVLWLVSDGTADVRWVAVD